MGIIIHGKTLCAICTRTLNEEDSVVSFPHYWGNKSDPFHKFSDASCHTKCLENDNLAKQALEHVKKMGTRPWPPPCFISGEIITDPDSFLGMGHFTDDHEHPLFPYNGACFDRNNFKSWDKNHWLVQEIKKLAESGHWNATALKWLAERCETCICTG